MAFFPIRLIKDKTNIDFMGVKWISITGTFIVMLLSFFCFWYQGFNLGIDFTGGVLIEAELKTEPDLGKMRDMLTGLDIGEVSLQNIGTSNRDILIRIGNQTKTKDEQMQTVEKVKALLLENFGEAEYRKIDFVGPQVGATLIENGAMALFLSLFGIMAYVWARFEWQYGVGVIIALFHDAIITLGFMSLTHLEFSIYSIAAVLTVVGFSVNDSVVIYDRIRENMRKFKSYAIDQIINVSINETLSRTTLTVLTILLCLLSLILFGGEVIYSFSMTVFFGIMVGTYSSIYISAPVLSFMKLKNIKNEEISKK